MGVLDGKSNRPGQLGDTGIIVLQSCGPLKKKGCQCELDGEEKLPQQQQKQQPQEHHDQDLFLLQVAGKDLTGSTEPKDLRDKGHKYIYVMGLFYNSKSCTGMMPVVLVKL